MVESRVLVLGQVFLYLVTQACVLNVEGPGLAKPYMSEASDQIQERQGKENNPCK